MEPIGLGESTDGDSNDDEVENEVKALAPEEDIECNFTFVGANVQTGKSSMRSKPKPNGPAHCFKCTNDCQLAHVACYKLNNLTQCSGLIKKKSGDF